MSVCAAGAGGYGAAVVDSEAGATAVAATAGDTEAAATAARTSTRWGAAGRVEVQKHLKTRRRPKWTHSPMIIPLK